MSLEAPEDHPPTVPPRTDAEARPNLVEDEPDGPAGGRSVRKTYVKPGGRPVGPV